MRFSDDQVIFRRPTDAETWSSILILHQNRPLRSTVRTTGSYINVQKLPTFFNLIIWGHEHESIVGLFATVRKKVYPVF